MVFVTDANNNRVQVFDGRGALLGTFGESGDGQGKFDTPAGIAVAGDGNVFVADSGNSRIQVFRPAQGRAAS